MHSSLAKRYNVKLLCPSDTTQMLEESDQEEQKKLSDDIPLKDCTVDDQVGQLFFVRTVNYLTGTDRCK